MHNGQMFSTRDNDHDKHLRGSCANGFHGAWWYGNCHISNLNGRYYSKQTAKTLATPDGIIWMSWKGLLESLKGSSMKLRHISVKNTVKG